MMFEYVHFYLGFYIIELVVYSFFLPADQRSGNPGPCFALCSSIQPDSVWSNNYEINGQPDEASELTDSRVVHRGDYLDFSYIHFDLYLLCKYWK